MSKYNVIFLAGNWCSTSAADKKMVALSAKVGKL